MISCYHNNLFKVRKIISEQLSINIVLTRCFLLGIILFHILKYVSLSSNWILRQLNSHLLRVNYGNCLKESKTWKVSCLTK